MEEKIVNVSLICPLCGNSMFSFVDEHLSVTYLTKHCFHVFFPWLGYI